jgi:hypothetical protein
MLITLYKTNVDDQIQYYVIDDRQGHLFSPYSFSVTRGPSLSPGREKQYAFETRKAMDMKLRKLIQSRIKSGYRVLYSYIRTEEYEHLRPALERAAVS